MTYTELLSLFESKGANIDETAFYFKDDPDEQEHFIGYLPQYDFPYWVGLCDIKNGCDYATAKELFEAKIFDGKSIKERWDDIVLFQIGGIFIDDYEDFISK